MKNKPKKSLGQNFLTDSGVCRRMARAAGLDSSEAVLEVGPGRGILTRELLATGAEVIAVETDEDLLPDLAHRFGKEENFTLIHGDIRRVNIPRLLAERGISRYKVVANLPYYITSSIIRLFLESAAAPTEMVLMVQREVAERLTAEPGKMSVLSVAVSYYARAEYLFAVPATSFDPQPKVQSAVVRIVRKKEAPEGNNKENKRFFRLVRAGFCARRKMLVNNLANSLGIDKDEIVSVLRELELPPTVRAQELSVAQWQKLSEKFGDSSGQSLSMKL